MAVLRYRVRNRGRVPATVAIAWSIENPSSRSSRPPSDAPATPAPTSPRKASNVAGLLMHNPQLDAADPRQGNLRARRPAPRRWRGHDAPRLARRPLVEQPAPLLGRLHRRRRARSRAREAAATSARSASSARSPPAREAEFAFVLAWHFPNRTPERCGWTAPKGDEKDVIGNWYATRFADAWAVAEHAAANLDELEQPHAAGSPPPCARPPCPRRREGRRHGESLDAREHHLLPHRRRRVPRLRRRQRSGRLLPRQLHARVELRDRHAASSSRALAARCAAPPSAIASDDAGRDAFPRRLCPTASERSGLRRRRRPDGPDHASSISTGSSPATTPGCASSGPRRSAPSSSPGSPAAGMPTATASWKACSTTPTTSSSTGRIRSAASTISARCAPARRWRAPWATPRRPREYRRLFDNGSKWIDAQSVQRRILHPEGPRRCRRTRSPPACAAPWASDDPENPQYQMGDGCLRRSAGRASTWRTSPASAPLRRAGEHPQDARIDLPLQLQAQRSPGTNPCSAPTRSTTRPRLVVCDYGKGDAPADPVPLLRRGVDRPGILDRRAHDVRRA